MRKWLNPIFLIIFGFDSFGFDSSVENLWKSKVDVICGRTTNYLLNLFLFLLFLTWEEFNGVGLARVSSCEVPRLKFTPKHSFDSSVFARTLKLIWWTHRNYSSNLLSCLYNLFINLEWLQTSFAVWLMRWMCFFFKHLVFWSSGYQKVIITFVWAKEQNVCDNYCVSMSSSRVLQNTDDTIRKKLVA